MARAKTQFICQQCAAIYPKWQGQCHDCKQWNCIVEENVAPQSGYAGVAADAVHSLDKIALDGETVVATGISEFDRVLGGGLVSGSVVLIGGDPGIGKSTLLLQTTHHLSQRLNCLYVSGEESPRQISLRAERLHLKRELIKLYSETQVEKIIATALKIKPQVLVIDSIQTLHSALATSPAGSVSQLRESTAQLVRFAKNSSTTVFLIGHVTKSGAIAGPRVLEHMVDTVLYFESENASRFRMLRAIKNRFGPVNELGMFAMLENGLKAVNNPSAIFLSRPSTQQAGSAILPVWEGSRALLVEVQALVDGGGSYARRVTQGLDGNRLAMLLAVLHRHCGIAMHDMDVYLNVVGGLKITETAADLAIIAAAYSSFKAIALAPEMAICGELGLAGEIRPVANGQARITAARQHGFTQIIMPQSNLPREKDTKICVRGVQTLAQVLPLLFEC